MRTSRIDSTPAPASTTPGFPTRPPAPPARASQGEAILPRNPQAIPGEYIVAFRPEVTPEEQRNLLKSFAPTHTEPLPLINGMLVKTDPARVPGLVGITPADRSKILFSQPNYRHEPREQEQVEVVAADDPSLAKQYHLENTGQTGGTPGADVKATSAWSQSRGKGVIVAIADTNIDITHPDIAPNVWTNPGEVEGNGVDDDHNGFVDDVHGWNFSRNSNRPQDGRDTHGTHVAGIIGAVQGNGIGGSGVAPDVTLMPVPILGGGGSTANAIKAFAYAVANGANVISNSWGNNTYEPALAEAVKKTTDAGVSVVVAAGNENWDTGVNGSYPDNYDASFAVAASDDKDQKASYSNRGTTTIDVAAPGDKILSTLPGNKYGSMSGTSMAAPVVSGLLALVKARFPHLSMREVEQRVLRSVQTGGSAKAWNTLVASGGRVDAEAALTPLATPTAPKPVAAAKAGAPVRLGWDADITAGQRFDVEVSTNPTATSAVAEDFEAGTAARAFQTAGDKAWTISDAVAKDGTKSFNVSGLGRGQQARLELTETITEPTQIRFDQLGGSGSELSFFINRNLQAKPATGNGWTEFSTTLQPGTYTFTWLATSKGGQKTPVAIDGLRIGSVSDAKWTSVGSTEAPSLDWTPDAPVEAAAVRVRPDNGRFTGDWVTGEPFRVS